MLTNAAVAFRLWLAEQPQAAKYGFIFPSTDGGLVRLPLWHRGANHEPLFDTWSLWRASQQVYIEEL